MALTTIDLHGKILQPVTNIPAEGTVTFKILDELRDNSDDTIYSPMEFVATLDVNGEFTITLPVTDDPNVTPLNWSYWVYVDTDIWNSGIFFIPLPTASGPVAEFADLLPLATTMPCTPDGTPCAPIGSIAAIEAEIAALELLVADLQADVDAMELQIAAIDAQILDLQAADVDLDARVDVLEITQGALVVTVNIHTNQIGIIQADILALQTALNNIDASQIVSGTLAYQRLGGTIAEADTVVFNRATLVNPGTAADAWQFQYNGNRTLYANEYNLLRVRGIPDVQVPARFMSHVTRDGTTLPIMQATLSDAATHMFQVLGNGDILAAGSLSMLPSTLAVAFTGTMANAALINDGNVANTGAPYAATTTYIPADNRVSMDGNVTNTGVSIPAQTTLFTVNAAHRPTAWVQFSVRTSTGLSVRLTLKGATGVVVADQAFATNMTLMLDGLNFRKA
jgi:hypothetical protein